MQSANKPALKNKGCSVLKRTVIALICSQCLVSYAEPPLVLPMSPPEQATSENIPPSVVQDKLYVFAVQDKISLYLRIPDGIPKSAVAIVKIHLLPNGTVDSIDIIQPSGYAAYDKAILKAIQQVQRFPVKQSWVESGKTEELRLVFRPYSQLQQQDEVSRGTVTTLLRVLVKADGSIGSIQVKQSCGYPQCDRAAMELVRKSNVARYLEGEKVDKWIHVKISDERIELKEAD